MIPTRNPIWTALPLALLLLAGCGDATKPDPGVKPAGPAPEAPSKLEVPKDKEEVKSLPVDPPKGAAASPDKLTDEEVAEIKKLPPEDQAIALAQVSCPVSGGHLGDPDMGVPIKQAIGDRTFFICCKGCISEVKNKPGEVLAKLKK